MENSKQPAFAVSREMCEMSSIETYPFGLTKREYFAGKALQGLLSLYKSILPNESSLKDMAKLSVKAADALLDALSNEDPTNG